MLAMREFYLMYKVPLRLYLPCLFIGGIFFYVSCRLPAYFLHAFAVSLFFIFSIRLLSAGGPRGSMSDIGPLGIGFFYISVFLSFQWFLRTETFGMEYIFLLYSSVWTADSIAYCIGTYIGKNKLYPAVSPNKTIEGAFGSIVGGVLGAVITNVVFNIPDLTLAGSAVIGAILGIATLIGDLIESMFKRDADVKDSGNIIPGHGGILDKIDGLLVAGPALYFILGYF